MDILKTLPLKTVYRLAIFSLIVVMLPAVSLAGVDAKRVQAIIGSPDFSKYRQEINAMGQEVLPVLARLYREGDETQRTRVSTLLWTIEWRSAETDMIIMPGMVDQSGGQSDTADVFDPNENRIREILQEKEYWKYKREIREMGSAILPLLIRLYKEGDEVQRTRLASIMWSMRWQSPEAKAALMEDIQTKNRGLRLNVQYALGSVSTDEDVVSALLNNMRNDPNPLFRDKAACALANDQPHLSERQKLLLFQGLVEALDDSKPQVRDIAIKALKIHTGQTKGYTPNGPLETRQASIAEWQHWLKVFEENL